MEILIPGLLLVALMVYASTRIKRTAAAAFEAETIETDDLVIQKPEGFLNNLNGDPRFVLEFYSKEYGEAATAIRAGRVSLSVKDATVDNAVAAIRNGGDAIHDDIAEVIGGRHYRLIETARMDKDSECLVTYKLAEKNGRVYQLKAIRLAETSDEFKARMDTFVTSFELK